MPLQSNPEIAGNVTMAKCKTSKMKGALKREKFKCLTHKEGSALVVLVCDFFFLSFPKHATILAALFVLLPVG